LLLKSAFRIRSGSAGLLLGLPPVVLDYRNPVFNLMKALLSSW